MGIGLVAMASLVFWIFSSTKGNHLQLEGKILKVRTGALTETDSIAVLDFRVRNPSDIPFVVRIVKVTLEKADGEKVEGNLVSKSNMSQLFEFNRFLGSPYNEALSLRDKVPPHEQVDRMAAAQFQVPQQDLESGKAIHLYMQDVDGPEFETSHPPK